MCFHIGSSGHRRDRSPSPPPRPVRRRRHFPEVSDPPSASTRHLRKQPGPKAIRQHTRRSPPLLFEEESSSAQTPRQSSRKQSDEPRAKIRSRRHRPSRHIQKSAASIPKDVEDSDLPAATLTRRQEKQSKSRLEDPVVDGETKEPEDQAGKQLKKSSAENKKTAENDEAESSSSRKTTVGTKEKQESKPSMSVKTTTTKLTKKNPSEGGSKTAGQTDAQKAAAARKLLPEVQSKASGVNEMNPQPDPDPQPI